MDAGDRTFYRASWHSDPFRLFFSMCTCAGRESVVRLRSGKERRSRRPSPCAGVQMSEEDRRGRARIAAAQPDTHCDERALLACRLDVVTRQISGSVILLL